MQVNGEPLEYSVIQCSGEDEGFPVSNLKNNLGQGWHSSKLCEFPIELGLRFEGEVDITALQILSHETMIPTRIEVFVCLPDDTARRTRKYPRYDQAPFVRLGYVSLSNNEASGYAARELKTVHLATNAVYMKLVLHKCHVNGMNYFNQVGLVNVTVLGRLISVYPLAALTMSTGEPELLLVEGRGVPVGEGAQSAPSPFDKETEDKLTELNMLKQKAVENEDYDAAKRYKEKMETIKQTAMDVIRLEHQKKVAVSREDYDTAKNLKLEIDRLRQNLRDESSRHVMAPPKPAVSRTHYVPAPADDEPNSFAPQPIHNNTQPPPPSNFDDRPAISNALASQTQQDEGPEPPAAPPRDVEEIINHPNPFNVSAANEGQRLRRSIQLGPGEFAEAAAQQNQGPTFDIRKLPEWEKNLHAAFLKACEFTDVDEIGQEKLREFSEQISIFGEFMGRALVSKKFQIREAAMKVLDAHMHTLPQGKAKGILCLFHYLGSKNFGLSDSIASTYTVACEFVKKGFEGVYDKDCGAQLGPALQAILPTLLTKASDNNQKTREAASTLLLMAASSKEVGCEKVAAIVLTEPKPDAAAKKKTGGSSAVNFRLYTSRLGTTQLLLDKFGLNKKDVKTGLTVDTIMTKLINPALQHAHNDVREMAVKIIVWLCKSQGHVMDKYLEPLKPALRQAIDDQLGGDDQPKQFKEGEMVSQSFSVEQGKGILAVARDAAKTEKAGSTKAPSSKPLSAEEKQERTCQFCGNFDERYTEQLLDLHFVRSCPMLTPCPLCVQVIEVPLLQDHLNDECEKRAQNYKQCARCKFAIKLAEYDDHVASKACIPASSDYVVCPLCMTKVTPPTEVGWNTHLLKAPGCSKNSRKYDGKGGEEFAKK